MATPSKYRAWQLSSTSGGLEKNLKLNTEVPMINQKGDRHLVQVIACALNPGNAPPPAANNGRPTDASMVDYKPAEVPGFMLLQKKPATPGIDFAGRIVQPANGSTLQPGQLIFGAAGAGIMGGALAEYATALPNNVAEVPHGLSLSHAATVSVAGLTAYQSIVPHVKEGSNVFINGGSGGTGVFGIQFAKAKGCHVTATCSTTNVELCKSLGADEVIDYKKNDVVQALKASGRKYDHVVDNVGADLGLFWRCHEYAQPGALFVLVGALVSFRFALEAIAARVWPGFLGGGKRKLQVFWPEPKPVDLSQIATWMKSGQVKAVVDEQFTFEDAPKAFAKLKTGRAKGKIVVHVAPESVSER